MAPFRLAGADGLSLKIANVIGGERATGKEANKNDDNPTGEL
jgi:hypothetical protein